VSSIQMVLVVAGHDLGRLMPVVRGNDWIQILNLNMSAV